MAPADDLHALAAAAAADGEAAWARMQRNKRVAYGWQSLGHRVFLCKVEPKPDGKGWLKTPLHKWMQEPAPIDPEWLSDRFRWQPNALPAAPVHDRVIIDCDRHKDDEDGVANFWELTKDEPNRDQWVATHTAGNGIHFHFAHHPEIFGLSTKGLPPGIDIIAGGAGYAILPGAVRADGKAWGVLRGDPTRADRLPPVPDSVLAAIRAVREAEKGAKRGQGFVAGRQATTAEKNSFKTALKRACAEIAAIPNVTGQGRNAGINSRAYAIFRMVAGGWGDLQEAQYALYEAALACGSDAERARNTLGSGWEAAWKNPRGPLRAPEEIAEAYEFQEMLARMRAEAVR
ncbi:bifunctional DNA primase/polymerase [Bosea sp. NPDC055353]